MAQSLLMSGAKLFLYVNGKVMGVVHSFEWHSNSPKKAIYGIDSNEPFELAPTTTSISGSVSVYKYMGDGGAEGAGMTPTNPNISEEKYFTLLLVDRVSSGVLFRADECSVTAQSWSVAVRGMLIGTIQFQALSWSNESSKFNR